MYNESQVAAEGPGGASIRRAMEQAAPVDQYQADWTTVSLNPATFRRISELISVGPRPNFNEY